MIAVDNSIICLWPKHVFLVISKSVTNQISCDFWSIPKNSRVKLAWILDGSNLFESCTNLFGINSIDSIWLKSFRHSPAIPPSTITKYSNKWFPESVPLIVTKGKRRFSLIKNRKANKFLVAIVSGWLKIWPKGYIATPISFFNRQNNRISNQSQVLTLSGNFSFNRNPF